MGCAVLAFQRFKAGGQAAFTEGIPEDGTMPDGQYQTYTATDGQYAEPPFNGGEQQGTSVHYWKSKKRPN